MCVGGIFSQEQNLHSGGNLARVSLIKNTNQVRGRHVREARTYMEKRLARSSQ